MTKKCCLALLCLCFTATLAEAKGKKAKPVAEEDNAAEAADETPAAPSSNGGRFGVAGGIGIGSGYLGVNLAVTYHLNRYVGLVFSGFYQSEKVEEKESTVWGPEFDLKLSLANRTVFTPFVGAGPGYESWKRTYKGLVIEEAGCMTGNAFVGLNVAVTHSFSIEVLQKTTMYLADPPLTFEDPEKREPKTFSRIQVGFVFSI